MSGNLIEKIPEGLKKFLGKIVIDRGDEKEIKWLLNRKIPEFEQMILQTKQNPHWETDEEDRNWIEALESYIKFIKEGGM